MPQALADSTSIAAKYTTLIQSLCDIAESYYYLGRLDDALSLLNAGLQIGQQRELQAGDHALLLLQRGKLGATAIFLATGDLDMTLADLTRAQQIAEEIHDRRLLGSALNLIGQAHYFDILSSGGQDWDAPRTYFQAALAEQEAIGDSAGACDSIFQLGLLHERKGAYDLAAEHYRRVLDLTAQHDHKRERSYAARHLGFIHHRQGDLEQARRWFEESLALREQIGLKLYIPFAQIALGDVLLDQGDSAGAMARYQSAHQLAGEMGLKAGLLSALLSLGYAHTEQRALPQALECFEQARSIAETIGFERGIAAAAAAIEELSKQQATESVGGDDLDD
jgi:tetratricopeptide (TPR) repeat protein